MSNDKLIGAEELATYNGWDRFDLKQQMQERGIPLLQFDLEYGHPAGAQAKIRADAFIEMLESAA